MIWQAVTASSPLHTGVHDTSPRPGMPSSVCTRSITNGDSEWMPKLPRMTNSGTIGTLTGIVSILRIRMDGLEDSVFFKHVAQVSAFHQLRARAVFAANLFRCELDHFRHDVFRHHDDTIEIGEYKIAR